MVIFHRNKIIVSRIKIFVPMKTIFVPIIKMRSALLDDDVDTGAGGDGSLHFYPPLPSITFFHSTTSQPLSALNCATLPNIFCNLLLPNSGSFQLLLSQVRSQRSNQSIRLTFLSNKCNEDLRSNNDLL